MDERRSRDTRARAELALLRLVYELRNDDVFLVVLGGLVPDVLARDDALIPEHLGTTDVDVLLITHVEPDADLGGVECALERIEFEPDPTADGWRWRGKVNGKVVKLEFLCDLPDQREGEIIRPRGCTALTAANLRGTGYVSRDFAWEGLSGELADGTMVTIRVRFAGLQGYLLSKCVAVRTRAATKDYYDLAYVLLHNRAGGPEQARTGVAQRAARRRAARTTQHVRRGPGSLHEDQRCRSVRVRRPGPPSRARCRRERTPGRRCRCCPAILRVPPGLSRRSPRTENSASKRWPPRPA